jgi:MoxR-like ATPase
MNQAIDIRELNERIQQESSFVDLITMEMNKVIVGQKHLVESLLIGLLSNGHILLEGVPGLAKTLAIKSLANTIDAKFARIQFTPDLLPADLNGNHDLQSETGGVFGEKRAYLRQLYTGRRNQPGTCQSAVGPARSDAGTPDHHR